MGITCPRQVVKICDKAVLDSKEHCSKKGNAKKKPCKKSRNWYKKCYQKAQYEFTVQSDSTEYPGTYTSGIQKEGRGGRDSDDGTFSNFGRRGGGGGGFGRAVGALER